MAGERTSRKRELTELFIKNIKTEQGRVTHRDTRVQGLVLRVAVSGTKTFAVMMRDDKGQPQTYTLGTYPDLSLRGARAEAEKLRHGVRVQGAVPRSRAKRATAQSLSLRDLLAEAQPILAKTRKGWKPRGPRAARGNSYNTILSVFKPILDRAVESLGGQDIATVVNAHRRSRPHDAKDTANGQVSRAMSYLSTVFDWAAGRGRFKKIGAGRETTLSTPLMSLIHDPSDDDVTISGKRERVLTTQEIAAVWPLLQYPAPSAIQRDEIAPEDDYGPIAHKFILLTLARVSEVAHACWRDFDFANGTWTRWVKAPEGQGVARPDRLPLSEAALGLLRSLPGYTRRRPGDLVFPNSDGGVQVNWDRITNIIQEASGTADWHRHDLRRTGSTILKELKVPPHVVDTILAHKEPFAREGVSDSASHYMVATRILTDIQDPKVEALDKLAKVLSIIAQHGKDRAAHAADQSNRTCGAVS